VTGIAWSLETGSGIVRAFLSGGDDVGRAPRGICEVGVTARGRLVGILDGKGKEEDKWAGLVGE